MELQDIDLKNLIERETGEHFNRQGYIKCPFHNEKTPSLAVKFYPDANKQRFKCFGCSTSGDSIDFIMKFKNMAYEQAREYLGLTVEKSEQEQQVERVQGFIDWQIKKFGWKDTLIGLFPFTNDKSEIAYFKAKFKDSEGKKRLSYYHIENDKVVNKRGSEELPYNLYNALQGIENDNVLIICEGEKDVNNLNSVLKRSNYVATSVKNVKDLSMYEGAYLYICGDTGEAGEKYKWSIYKKLFGSAKSFKFINLPGIKSLGDNKDVTDWLDAGHDKKDLLNAFDRSLDLKNKYELQQDSLGIYKTIAKDGSEKKIYMTNFNVVDATAIHYVNEDVEGIKLSIKTSFGGIIEKRDYVTVFDDPKSFRNFLGSMDLIFKGRVDDLMNLKAWVNKYFAIEKSKVYSGTRFVFENNDIKLVTQDGMITSKGVNTKIKSDGGTAIKIVNIDPIGKEELQKLMKYLFEFAPKRISYSVVGTIINNLAIAQAIELNISFHHLLLAGESGGGKSTVMENVIAAILNYPKDDIKSITLTTPFAMEKALSEGNYSLLFEEFKPSKMNDYKKNMISEILRNSYDRHTVDRGNRNLKSNTVLALTRPLILAGEETFINNEKALNERSCIIYLSKNQRTKEQTTAMEWIINHQDILNKLGRSLIEIVLNMSVEEYKTLRENEFSEIKGIKDRPGNTAANICTGIAILNELINQYGLQKITNYENVVVANIRNEILDDMDDSLSEVEKILALYDQIIGDGRIYEDNVKKAVQRKDGSLYIRTSEMYNQIFSYMKDIGNKQSLMELKDFKKQAKMAGYLLKASDRQIKVESANIRFDLYDISKIKKLGLESLAPPDIFEDEWEKGEQKVVFPDKFNKGN
ncbi:MAG: CHC2 zinc finger domain-containing protein [Clostridium sp.]|uniref:CHC2 zinc finger domain-containing protein n=1 Tax=Clostridium sp. TaxID=1506 RepID=UPI0025BF82CB|nr:CHC2 zinc finger domain-containing protein [Clostridium sp.]MCH3962675.1 CHC2 zinc finger domain-containing protein [Clostridium sp.]MCI2201060.1 CHC2 zinc finger domain-containing protein [Clostridium sp.]